MVVSSILTAGSISCCLSNREIDKRERPLSVKVSVNRLGNYFSPTIRHNYSGQTGWFQVGGTSASCPMWGAIVALSDQQRVSAKKSTLSGADVPLYLIAGSFDATRTSLYGYFFNDVTSGSNGSFSATPKYDEVTGLGTPITQNLVPGLAAY